MIEHYIRVAPRILPFLANRALMTSRFPDGVDNEGFYEKNAPRGPPEWVKIFRVASDSGGGVNYVVGNDLDTLLWLANLAALEIHVTLTRTGDIGKPDLLLFDLDPEPPAGFHDAVDVARVLREALESLGLKCYVKSTGKKGLHVLLPSPLYTTTARPGASFTKLGGSSPVSPISWSPSEQGPRSRGGSTSTTSRTPGGGSCARAR